MNREPDLFSGELDAVLVTSVDNIRYTTGFHTAARRPAQIGQTAALLLPDRALLFCPANWADVAGMVVNSGIEIVAYRGDYVQLAESIVPFLTENMRIGFEEEDIEFRLHRLLNGKCNAAWIDTSEVFRRKRLIKSEDEIERLRRSARLASETMEYAVTLLKPGKTEWQVVSELEFYMRERGSAGTPFTIKVLAGDNALRTINLPGDRVMERGDIVLIDMGALVEGYASDWTRSFVLGKPTQDQRELYELVYRLEQECIARIRAGVGYDELMQVAYKFIAGHRFEKYFNPFLGHNIGLSSQELPNIIPGSNEIFAADSVVTIEPGIYVPGVGGVRIEDEVLVKESGVEILTGLKEEIFELSC